MGKILFALMIAFVAYCGGNSSGALADGYCPSRPNGVCPKAKIFKPDSRNNYTEAQRAKFRAAGLIVCQRKYSGSTLSEIDYYRRTYVCGQ